MREELAAALPFLGKKPLGALRMPAEWERHDATWIAWPHHEPDWPGKLGPIPWVYAEIVRALHRYEPVDILCHDESVRASARDTLAAHGVVATDAGMRNAGARNAAAPRAATHPVRLHVAPNDRVWVRDSGPTGALREDGSVVWVNWAFNAWAKYDNYTRDALVGRAVADATGLARVEPQRPDGQGRLVLEGGGIETNGQGIMLVTEEWLLSDVQVRNPGLGREDYERAFREWLGIRQTIWLGEGCVGDDTHGHIDDVARFVGPDTIVLAYEADPADDNHLRSADNLERLQLAGGDRGALRVVTLPFPRAVEMEGQRLPASYANFYVGNGVVLVPTFNDRNDRVALNTLAELMPDHDVVGVHAVDLVWGLGTLHCLTQQQPAAQPRSGR